MAARDARQPLAAAMPTGRFPRIHPAGDGSLGDIKAQHEQFAMNARRAQVGFSAIIRKISFLSFRRQFFPTDLFSRLRDQTPVQSKPARCQRTTVSGLTSTRDCFQAPQKRRANTQKILSTAPIRGMLALQHGQLLPEGEIFQEQASMRCKQRVNRPNHNPTWRNIRDSHSRYCR